MIISDKLAYSSAPVTPNLLTGGVIGAAVSTVDQYVVLPIFQVTVGQTLTLPVPTDLSHSAFIAVPNHGSASFLMHGTVVAPLGVAFFIYSNGSWNSLSAKINDEIVDVTGATFPIVFPVAAIPGAPIFTPAEPQTAGKTYAITSNLNVVYAKWNGTQYISAPAPLSSVTVTDNANGSTTINAGAGQTQDAIRTGLELAANTPNSTSLDEHFVATRTADGSNVKFARIQIAAIPAGVAPFTISASSALTISAELLTAANTPSVLTLPTGNFIGQKAIISNVNGATATIAFVNTDSISNIILSNSQTYTAIWNRFRWVQETKAGITPQSGATFIDVATSTSQTLGAAFTTINFQVASSNQSGAFNLGTSLYTVPSSGIYQITGNLRSSDGTPSYRQWGVGVHTSNADGPWFLWHAVQNTTSGSNRTTYPYIRVSKFNAGDQLRMLAFSDSGPMTFLSAAMQIIKISD